MHCGSCYRHASIFNVSVSAVPSLFCHTASLQHSQVHWKHWNKGRQAQIWGSRCRIAQEGGKAAHILNEERSSDRLESRQRDNLHARCSTWQVKAGRLHALQTADDGLILDLGVHTFWGVNCCDGPLHCAGVGDSSSGRGIHCVPPSNFLQVS